MVEPHLFTETFKPNIAAYYLKLRTFINHRREIQGKHHARFYESFTNLSLKYLEDYAKDDPEVAKNCSMEKLFGYIENDENLDLTYSIAKQLKARQSDCPEMAFISLFLENYTNQLKTKIKSY
jgi:hypothetical protein